MYNELTLYYLHQLSITPWIRKNKDGKVAQSASLIVVLDEQFTPKTEIFFHKLLHFLHLQKQDLMIIQSHQLQDQKSPLNHSALEAVLFVGEDNLILGKKIDCPVYSIPGLQHLIDHPLEKKTILIPLMTLKQQLSLRS